jgi:hypothetical protein
MAPGRNIREPPEDDMLASQRTTLAEDTTPRHEISSLATSMTTLATKVQVYQG